MGRDAEGRRAAAGAGGSRLGGGGSARGSVLSQRGTFGPAGRQPATLGTVRGRSEATEASAATLRRGPCNPAEVRALNEQLALPRRDRSRRETLVVFQPFASREGKPRPQASCTREPGNAAPQIPLAAHTHSSHTRMLTGGSITERCRSSWDDPRVDVDGGPPRISPDRDVIPASLGSPDAPSGVWAASGPQPTPHSGGRRGCRPSELGSGRAGGSLPAPGFAGCAARSPAPPLPTPSSRLSPLGPLTDQECGPRGAGLLREGLRPLIDVGAKVLSRLRAAGLQDVITKSIRMDSPGTDALRRHLTVSAT